MDSVQKAVHNNKSTMRTYATVLSLFCLVSATLGFAPVKQQLTKETSLNVVKFDKEQNKWITTDPATEGPEAGYDVIGSLLRSGPKAPIVRLINPDKYEQAVLKFMASDNVDRLEAQGNMDAFFENAQDWAYYRTQGLRPDYVTIKTDQIVLRVVWSAIVFGLGGRALVSYFSHVPYWDFVQ